MLYMLFELDWIAGKIRYGVTVKEGGIERVQPSCAEEGDHGGFMLQTHTTGTDPSTATPLRCKVLVIASGLSKPHVPTTVDGTYCVYIEGLLYVDVCRRTYCVCTGVVSAHVRVCVRVCIFLSACLFTSVPLHVPLDVSLYIGLIATVRSAAIELCI